jgi:hypothetical protein
MTEVMIKAILEEEVLVLVEEGNKETEDKLAETKKSYQVKTSLWMMVNPIL